MFKLTENIDDLVAFDHVPVGVCVIDPDFLVRFWNRALENWTGIMREDILNKEVNELFPVFNKQSYRSRFDSIFQGGAPVIFSSQLHKQLFTPASHKAKQVHHTTITALPRSNGHFYALVSVENVTELSHRIQLYRQMRDQTLDEIKQRKLTEIELVKAKQRAEEADKLKSAFIANMSHEIRTPLNGIIGFSEFLRTKELDRQRQVEYLDIINSSGRHLLSLINDVIDISKIEAGRIKLEETEFSLNALLDDLHTFFLSDLKNQDKDEDVSLLLDKGLDNDKSHILTDELRLRQILTNLLSNAIKFTEQGEISFGYSLIRDERGKIFVKFHVTDTGIGISPKEKKIIFGRFVQADNSIERSHGGTGLGLAICKGLVEILGGSISLVSKEGQGSTFYFTVPYRPVDISPSGQDYSEDEESYNWQGRHILIIEGMRISYFFLKVILQETKVKLTHVDSGKAAIEFCQANSCRDIDLILMDVQLPQMDGLDVVKKIKTFKPDMPVVVQTANALAEDEQRAREAGCDEYITKPINRIELLQKINRYF